MVALVDAPCHALAERLMAPDRDVAQATLVSPTYLSQYATWPSSSRSRTEAVPGVPLSKMCLTFDQRADELTAGASRWNARDGQASSRSVQRRA